MGYSNGLLHRNSKHIFGPKDMFESKTYLWTEGKKSRKDWKKAVLCIMLYHLYGLISVAGLLLCFCSFFFSLSLWLARYFFLFFNTSSLWFLFCHSFSQTISSHLPPPITSSSSCPTSSYLFCPFCLSLPCPHVYLLASAAAAAAALSPFWDSPMLVWDALILYNMDTQPLYVGLKQSTTCDIAKHGKNTNSTCFYSAVWHTLVFVIKYNTEKRSCSPCEFQVASG